MESNQQQQKSDENYEELFEELAGPNGDQRKVFVQKTKKTTTIQTQKSIITTSSTSSSSSQSQPPVPVPRSRHRSSTSSSSVATTPLENAPGVCSNITTIVFRDEQDVLDSPHSIDVAADFARLESLARQREEAPGTPSGGLVKTTTTVHQRTITHLNPSQQSSPLHSVTLRPTTLPIRQQHSSENDSLLEDLVDDLPVAEESATFQNIHKFTSTYESTPLSSPMQSRFTSGDSLYRSTVNFSSSCAASPMGGFGSPLSGSHHNVATDEWTFNRTHQFQTKTGFYRSISQYDSHIKEIRGESEKTSDAV